MVLFLGLVVDCQSSAGSPFFYLTDYITILYKNNSENVAKYVQKTCI